MSQNKKENFFKKIYNSLTNFDKYVEYCLERVSKPLIYLLKISVLVSVILSSIAMYNFYKNDLNFMKNNLSDFEYKDNTLNFQGVHNFEKEDVKIIIDTHVEKEEEITEYKKEASLYDNSIILLKDKAIANFLEQEIEFEYKNILSNIYFNKAMLIDQFSGINLVYILIQIYIITTLVNFLNYLMLVLVLSIFGMILKYMLKLNLRYSNVFNICVYAYTLPIILELVFSVLNMLFGFKIYRFDLMADIISYIYILAAMISIRSNAIKRQIEFAKLKMAMDKNNSDNESNNNNDINNNETNNSNADNEE